MHRGLLVTVHEERKTILSLVMRFKTWTIDSQSLFAFSAICPLEIRTVLVSIQVELDENVATSAFAKLVRDRSIRQKRLFIKFSP
jgi:hypothetical protein